MSRLQLLFPTIVVIVGGVMLAVPWIVPVERADGRSAVFVISGLVELVLGFALAYLALQQPGERGDGRRPRA